VVGEECDENLKEMMMLRSFIFVICGIEYQPKQWGGGEYPDCAVDRRKQDCLWQEPRSCGREKAPASRAPAC
jgi:hypothetical protein